MNPYCSTRSILDFWKVVIWSIIIAVPLGIAVASETFGPVGELITDIVDLIPFGESILGLAVHILNSLCDQSIDVVHNEATLTVPLFLGEMAKVLFTAIIYEGLNIAAGLVFGLTDEEGLWNGLSRVVISMVMALVAACLEPALMGYVLAHLGDLSVLARWLISAFIAVVLMGGGTMFFAASLGLSTGMAILYVLVKVLLVSAAKLVACYAFILLILEGIESGVFVSMLEGAGGLLSVILVLGGIELALDAVFS